MKVVVIGGGISGLASAWWIRELGRERGEAHEVHVLEAAPRLGGTIYTDHRDGYRCEWGPNGFLDSKPDTLELAERLGLTERLLRSSDEANKRFVLVDGRLIEIPTSPMKFMTSPILSFGGRLRVLREPFVGRGTDPEETVGQFARRRLGPQAAQRLIDPFVSGIFAGDPDQLSLRAAFPRLAELEEQYGSLIKASQKLKKARGKDANAAGPSGRLTTFPGGLSEIVDRLASELGDFVHVRAPAAGLRREAGKWAVEYEGEAIRDVDAVVLATPAPEAARLTRPLTGELAHALSGIPYAAATVVGLGYRRSELGHDLDGFGFLCPAQEQRKILGCLWTSSLFPGHRAPEDHVLLRLIVGGVRAPEMAMLDDEPLLDTVFGELRELMGVDAVPVYKNVIRHVSAIPQYVPGHMGRLASIEEALGGLPGLHMTGNALRGVGINDCTRAAKAVALQVVGVEPS